MSIYHYHLTPKIAMSASEARETINIIGEPFLKEKLNEMYYEKHSTDEKINQLEIELERLKRVKTDRK